MFAKFLCHLPKTHLNWNYVRVLPSISNNFPKNKRHSTSKLIKIAFLLTHIIFLYFKLFKQNTRAWTSCARHRQVWKTVQKNSCSNETLFSLLNISAGLKKKQQIYIINNLLKKAHVISQNAGNVINKHLKDWAREGQRPRKMGTKTCRKLWEMRRNLWIDKWAICVFFVKKAVIIIIIVTVVVFIIIIMNIRQQHHHIITVPSIIPSTAFVSLSAAHKASAALSNLARKDIKITENVVKYLSAEHLILSSVG